MSKIQGAMVSVSDYNVDSVYKKIYNKIDTIDFELVDSLYTVMRQSGFSSLVPDYKIINKHEMYQEKLLTLDNVLYMMDKKGFECNIKAIKDIMLFFCSLLRKYSNLTEYLQTDSDKRKLRHIKTIEKSTCFVNVLEDLVNIDNINIIYKFLCLTLSYMCESMGFDIILNELNKVKLDLIPQIDLKNVNLIHNFMNFIIINEKFKEICLFDAQTIINWGYSKKDKCFKLFDLTCYEDAEHGLLHLITWDEFYTYSKIK